MSFFDKWKKKIKEALRDIFLEPDVDSPLPKPKSLVKKPEQKTSKKDREETKVRVNEKLIEPKPLKSDSIPQSQSQPLEDIPKAKTVDAVTTSEKTPRHHAARRPVARPVSNRIKRAIVGVDFGTSYTKAWCNIAQWDEFAITFDVDGNRSFFLPTVLYYNAKTNKLAINSGIGYAKIEYFKYGMINDSLCTTGGMLAKNKSAQNKMDFICSVFFMANVIKLIKVAVQKKYSESKIEIDFNMGCPLDNFKDSSKRIYDDVLNLAYKLCEYEKFESLTVAKLDSFIKENKDYKNSSLQTVAELYAEALWFIEQPSVGEGIYSVLDIGGGTADFATLSVKWVNSEKKTKIFSQKAVPLGVEILLKKLYPLEYQNNRETCVANFRKENVVIPSFANKKELVNPHHVFGQQFQEGFFEGIMAVKNIDRILMSNQWNEGFGKLPYYTFGGGADIGWYHSIIKNNKEMKKACVPQLVRKNVSEKEPRLIIARQLSRPYFPEIDGFPWTFVNNDPQIDGSDLYRNTDYGILDT